MLEQPISRGSKLIFDFRSETHGLARITLPTMKRGKSYRLEYTLKSVNTADALYFQVPALEGANNYYQIIRTDSTIYKNYAMPYGEIGTLGSVAYGAGVIEFINHHDYWHVFSHGYCYQSGLAMYESKMGLNYQNDLEGSYLYARDSSFQGPATVRIWELE